MKQIEMTGKTINEAVDNACTKLGVSILDVDYKVIDEPTKGFLGIGAKPAKVLVTVIGSDEPEIKSEPNTKVNSENMPEPNTKVNPEDMPESKVEKIKAEPKIEKTTNVVVEEKIEEIVEVSDEEPVENESVRASLTDEDKNNILAIATGFLTEVFEQMNMSVELNASFKDNKHIVIDMNGDDMGTIIGKRGQTLDSIQYLTNLVVNKGEYPYMNITLDTEAYRAERQKPLEQLAFNLAKKAKHNRRTIHATLQNDRYVTTYSEGTEPYRYVVIALKNNYSSRRNYNN